MEKLKILDLFSGIGGFSLGLQRTGGFETVAFCEIEPYCQKVLRKHWPNVPLYEDVREITADRLDRDGIRPDVITGGFPCQDISVAGKGAGIEGERSGLWSELCRIIGEVQPRYAIMENVTNLISGDRGRWFGRVLGDLAEIGYDAEWHCIPASALGAHHHRDRVWIIAYPNCQRLEERENVGWISQKEDAGKHKRDKNFRIHAQEDATYTGCREQKEGRLYFGVGWQYESIQRDGDFKCTAEPLLGGAVNGIPHRLDRLKGLGNAVVPQIPELIGRAILGSRARI